LKFVSVPLLGLHDLQPISELKAFFVWPINLLQRQAFLSFADLGAISKVKCDIASYRFPEFLVE
jgi:hypothetical protein